MLSGMLDRGRFWHVTCDAAFARAEKRGPVADGAPMRRRFLVPEVIQTSVMDCGPAALKALFGGFGIYLSYGRLREANQTDIDGTSIDHCYVIEGVFAVREDGQIRDCFLGSGRPSPQRP